MVFRTIPLTEEQLREQSVARPGAKDEIRAKREDELRRTLELAEQETELYRKTILTEAEKLEYQGLDPVEMAKRVINKLQLPKPLVCAVLRVDPARLNPPPESQAPLLVAAMRAPPPPIPKGPPPPPGKLPRPKK